ncbi:MAG: LON peptidase substrate-binding domain-containing protein [Alphaproteobacteria bacterium]|nr:LON peptidase substrate-binding domain-containing protein [Alphaproteobacteria bacterium]
MNGDAAPVALPEALPLLPLNGVLLLPRGNLPLNVFEPRYLAMVDAALAGSRAIGIVQPAADGTEGLSAPDGTNLYRTGCVGRIRAFEETDDGRYIMELRGISRFDIAEELEMESGFRRVRPDYGPYAADLHPDPGALADRDRLLTALKGYFEVRNIAADWDALVKTPDERLITTLSMVCPFDPAEKQVLLEAPEMGQRCKLLIGFMEAALREAGNDNAPGNPALN